MKKLMTVLLAAVLMAALVAACGGNGGGNAGGSKTGDEGAGNEKVTLQLAHHMGEEGARLWIEDFVRVFEEKYPNVKVETVATSYDNYHTMLRTKIAGDDATDVMLLARLDGSDKTYIEEGYIADLSDQPYINNVIGIERHKIDGKVYGLPFDMNAYGVMYNKELFANAGIAEVPRTYSAFIEVLEKLKASGVDPIAAGYKELSAMNADLTTDVMNSQFSKNPNYRKDAEERKFKFAEEPSMREALLRLAERFEYVQPDPFGTDRTTYASLVASGQAAMLLNGSWFIDSIKAINPDIDLGFFPFPYSDNEDDNRLPLGTGVGGWAVYNDSPNKEWALKLLEVIASKEMGESLQKNKKAVSTVKGLGFATDPTFQDIGHYQDNDLVYDYTGAYTSFAPEYSNAFLQQLTAFLMDPDKDVDAALRKMDEDFDRIFKLR